MAKQHYVRHQEETGFGRIASFLYNIPTVIKEADQMFLLIIGLLQAFGLVTLLSAGSARAFATFGDSFWYFKNQLFQGLGLGIPAMLFFASVNYHVWGKLAKMALLCSWGSLILVLIPGVGTTINGATRWLLGIQPSEFAKYIMILWMSYTLSKNQHKLKNFRDGFLPYLIVLGVFSGLLLLEPHMSCTMLIVLTGFVLMIAGGAEIKHFVWIGGPVILVVILAIISAPYRMERVTSFLDPFADLQGSGWQIVQSLYAIGSGGIFGLGLGQSRQKYRSLPEPQNDFIYSVLAEELGLLGAMILIALFIFFIIRGIRIALKAPDLFGKLVVTGIIALNALQIIINIAVVTASMPVTGMPLPFFSFGGTALVCTLSGMGIVLNVSRQIKKPI